MKDKTLHNEINKVWISREKNPVFYNKFTEIWWDLTFWMMEFWAYFDSIRPYLLQQNTNISNHKERYFEGEKNEREKFSKITDFSLKDIR